MTRHRPLTAGEALDAWRVDGELRGGHLPSETIAFVSALEDVEDRRRALPSGVISPDVVRRGWLRRWFDR